MVIRQSKQRLEHFFDIEEVGDEAGLRIHFALQSQLDAVRVTMQSVAAVFNRNARQPMRRLEPESLGTSSTPAPRSSRAVRRDRARYVELAAARAARPSSIRIARISPPSRA